MPRDAHALARYERAYKLRQLALTLAAIGALLGVSRERARQMVHWYEWQVLGLHGRRD